MEKATRGRLSSGLDLPKGTPREFKGSLDALGRSGIPIECIVSEGKEDLFESGDGSEFRRIYKVDCGGNPDKPYIGLKEVKIKVVNGRGERTVLISVDSNKRGDLETAARAFGISPVIVGRDYTGSASKKKKEKGDTRKVKPCYEGSKLVRIDGDIYGVPLRA